MVCHCWYIPLSIIHGSVIHSERYLRTTFSWAINTAMYHAISYSSSHTHPLSLTLWEPGYDIFVLWFRPKTSSCQLPYQRPSSSTNCARELFNGSNGSASLVDYTRKKIFCWWVRIFCEWRRKWSSFRVILAHVARPRAQLLGQSVSLKFSLETRLESESLNLWSTF